MKKIILSLMALLLLSVAAIAVTPYFPPPACVLTAVNAAQRTSFSQPGVVQGFTTGCLVVQQDTSVVYEWDGTAYNVVGGGGVSTITSLNAQTGATQVFASDTNLTITSASNTHTLGWLSILSAARGGSGSALIPSLGNIVYTNASRMLLLPAGTSGQVLTSGGAAAPSWASNSYFPGGANTQVQFNDSGIFGGSSTFTLNKNNGLLNVYEINMSSTITMNGSTILKAGSITPNDDASAQLGTTLKRWASFSTVSADVHGVNRIYGATSGSVGLQASSVGSTYTLTLPSAAGAAGSVLYYSGSGVLEVLAPGTSGQTLRSNGAAAPSWQ